MTRDEQNALWQMEDEVIDRLGLEEWRKVLHDSTYNRPTEKIEFYRDSDGLAQYRWRPLTAEELHETIEGRIEDQL